MSGGNSDAVNGSRFGFGGALPAGEAAGSAVGWAIEGTSSGVSDTRPAASAGLEAEGQPPVGAAIVGIHSLVVEAFGS